MLPWLQCRIKLNQSVFVGLYKLFCPVILVGEEILWNMLPADRLENHISATVVEILLAEHLLVDCRS